VIVVGYIWVALAEYSLCGEEYIIHYLMRGLSALPDSNDDLELGEEVDS